MMRRGFLGALLGAPVAAQNAIASGASAVGVSYPANMVGGSYEEPDEEWLAHDRLADRLHDALHFHKDSDVEVSASINAMKSWSPVFKQHVALKEIRERRSIHRAINDAMRDRNPITRGLALARIASDMGEKL
ncbi:MULTISPECIES: hypothetical protein [unclassified Mameliella]|uniref:hypothetical protein n=1 Tax=Mameliella sp. LZ-28 TaxID=2484146 RepID=UPI00143F177A|nr:hypothetical protein [Mameliella sp. LZ-28]